MAGLRCPRRAVAVLALVPLCLCVALLVGRTATIAGLGERSTVLASLQSGAITADLHLAASPPLLVVSSPSQAHPPGADDARRKHPGNSDLGELDLADELFNATASAGRSDCSAPRTLVDRANCGSDFARYFDGDLAHQSKVRVALFGRFYNEGIAPLRRISGCPVGESLEHGPRNAGCVQDPACRFVRTRTVEELQALDPDVILFTKEVGLELTEQDRWDIVMPRNTSAGRRRYRVLYVREASAVGNNVQKHVDFIMGISYWSSHLNPNFLMRPASYVRYNQQNQRALHEREFLAMSLISNCEPTRSLRGLYINALVKEFGKKEIHQYGSCGDGHKAPTKPLGNIAEVAAKYKFYLAFENTIMDGYVTEKLFRTLTFGPVPIYMGAPDVLSITTSKSFINVLDFGSPSELTAYLRYLVANETAYNEYHAWRRVPPEDAFTPEYLQLVSEQRPSPAVYQKVAAAYGELSSRKVNPGRVASCCQLCNRNWLPDAAARPQHPGARHAWTKTDIQSKLYDGERGRPLPTQRAST